MTRLKVKAGATFRYQWIWYEGDDVVKLIASIVRGFPSVLTATSHGMPTLPIPVALINAGQFSTLDADGEPSHAVRDRIAATKLSSSTFSIDIDSSRFAAYGGSGFVAYTPPKDLTGYTGRWQARVAPDSADVLLELTTTGGGLVLGGVAGSIDLVMTDAQTTALYAQPVAQWNLELIAAGPGDVTRYDEGTLEVSPDINRV